MFRSSMGTLLYLSQDRVDIQHAVRNLSQWMSGVRHLVLYLKGTPTYGVFLPYMVASNSKLEKIHGKSSNYFNGERVEVFTDSDWAGDRSNTERRRRSVSSRMAFVNGRLATSWSRTQKSIALSICKIEYLAAAGGGAKRLFIGRLWHFLVHKDVSIALMMDSSSGKAFAQRLGIRRMKHIVKFLWLQKVCERAVAQHGECWYTFQCG